MVFESLLGMGVFMQGTGPVFTASMKVMSSLDSGTFHSKDFERDLRYILDTTK